MALDQDSMQAPGSPESRTGAFGTGLSEASTRFMSRVPQGFAQHSVLQQSLPSANGMSAQDYERILPGVNNGGRPVILPSQNGTSAENWQKTTYMRLNGRNVI
jgi:hypothetical protein